MTSLPLGLGLYRTGTALAAPLAGRILDRRARAGREDRSRLDERLGQSAAPRPEGRLIWIHGVSVGEAFAALNLADRLAAPDQTVLLTTATTTAAAALKPRLGPGRVHQYAPLDTPGATARFIAHWRPDLGIIVENELWPNLILAARTAGCRTAWVSARLSERSLAGWRRWPRSAARLIGGFDLILARDAEQARGIAGLARVDGELDLKFGAPPLPCNAADLDAFRRAWSGRKVLAAVSTHPGEEALILDAFAALPVSLRKDALLLLAPRHPDRGPAVAELVRERGFGLARRADGVAAPEVFLADTIGEMGLWLRLADLVLLGGAWAEGLGGHNPLEAARLAAPLATGPRFSASPLIGPMAAAGQVRIAPDGDALTAVMREALTDDPGLRAMARAAQGFAAARDADAEAALAPLKALAGA